MTDPIIIVAQKRTIIHDGKSWISSSDAIKCMKEYASGIKQDNRVVNLLNELLMNHHADAVRLPDGMVHEIKLILNSIQ